MTPKTIRIIALAIVLLVMNWFLIILAIIVAHVVQGVMDDSLEPMTNSSDLILPTGLLLAVVAAVIAIFKQRIGSVLIVLAAVILLLSDLDDLHVGRLPQFVYLFAGLLLLASTYLPNRPGRTSG